MDENKNFNDINAEENDSDNNTENVFENELTEKDAEMTISIDSYSVEDDNEDENTFDEEYDDNKKSFNIWKEIREWAFAIISAIVVVMIIKTFIFDCVYVSGSSMKSTLLDGDRLVLVKMGYQPQKGDIIVLDANYEKRHELIEAKKSAPNSDFGGIDEFMLKYLPWEQRTYGIEPHHYVKRIIATEGDVIDIDEKSNKVLVNGVAIDEPYIDEGMHTLKGNEVIFPYTVEEGHVFVMGDNRENSRDSRSGSLTTVPVDAVDGKAVFRFWPLNAIGTVD